MIKVLLKHLIYETCISTFFKHIGDNFFSSFDQKVPLYMWEDYRFVCDSLKQYDIGGARRSLNQFKIVANAYEMYSLIDNRVMPSKADLEYFYNKMVKYKWMVVATTDLGRLNPKFLNENIL